MPALRTNVATTRRLLGQCQDDRSHVNNGRVIGGCLPAPVPYATTAPNQWDNLLTTDVEGVTVGAHSKCLVRTTGQGTNRVYCWGYLRNGMLGSDIALRRVPWAY